MKSKLTFRDKIYQINQLTKRNLLIFLKNPTSIFFSLITPVLILVIFIFLINDDVLSMALQMVPELGHISLTQIKVIAHGWMVAGIVGVAVLTVGLNTMFVRIKDQENKTINDYVASPVNIVFLTLSYFLSSFILTFAICFIFLIAGLAYLSISYSVGFSFLAVLELIAILILGTLSGTIILMVITSFFTKTSSASSFTGIFSALIGFLIGAYLPIGMLPSKGLQNFANLMPGSHTTGLFRKVIVDELIGPLDLAGVEGLDLLRATFGIDLTLFNYQMPKWFMYVYLIISIIVFFVIYLLIEYSKRNVHLNSERKRKKSR